jgi:BirA family transcriptional regulator, biotin operon repressor / biotin---[acetyl-CoA-carboxylase] ligase
MDFSAYVAELRSEPLFRELDLAVLHTTDSTNSAARRVVAELAERRITQRRFLLTAWHQSGGRGRRGRPWASRPGAGVWASLAVPEADEELLLTLPLRVAVALCRSLTEVSRVACRVKWPNDILLDGRKLVGVLVEMARRGSRRGTTIIGFGVNREPSGVADTAALIEAQRHPPELPRLTAALAGGILAELERKRSAAEISAEYRELSIHREGEPIRWKTAEGIAEGTFRGFDPRGFLRVEVAGEERRLAAAELVEG